MGDAPASQERRARAWLTAGLCALFCCVLLAQELMLLFEIAPPEAPLATWRWRLLLPLSLVSVALLLPWRARWWFLGATGACASLALLADAAYFRFFGSLTSLRAAVSMHQLWGVRDSVLDLVEFRHVLITLLLIALGGASMWLTDPRVRRSREVAASLALAVMLAVMAVVAWQTPIYEATHHIGRDPWQLPAQHWGARFSPVRFATAFGPLNYHARDLASWLRAKGAYPVPLTAGREAELGAWLEHKHALNATPSPLFGLARGRHVVIIQLESWQHFLVDRSLDGVEITPCFNRLARSGLTWDYVMDVTHHGRTSDAEFALHAGLLPDVRKPAAFSHLGSVAVTLPRSLRRLGYRTASFHGYERAFWNRAYTHPEWGIEEMYFAEAFRDAEQLGLGASDRAVYRFVAQELASWDPHPTLAFVISLSSHHPYIYTPPEYAHLFAALSPAKGYGLVGAYLRSARYADDALGELIREMQRLGLHERTLYVIYGDHDMGGLGATRPVPEIGAESFSPAGDRIPLLIAVPGEEGRLAEQATSFRTTIGGLHDLFPTILHLLGEAPPFGIEGTHLFVPADQRDALPLPHEGSYALGGVLYTRRGALPLVPGSLPHSNAAGVLQAERERTLLEDLLDWRLQARLASARVPASARLASGD